MRIHFRQGQRSALWIAALGIAWIAFNATAQNNESQSQQVLPRYIVTDLGTLGGTYSQAGGISNGGWVAGVANLTGDTALHAVLWRAGMIKDLGTLGGPNSGVGFWPSDSGNAAGGSDTTTPDPNAENFCGFGTNLICLPFLWRNDIKKK